MDIVRSGCGRGGHCCQNVHVPLTAFDVLRLARFLGTTTTGLLSEVTVITEEGGVEIDGEVFCPFLDGTECSVYEARPDACRMYPFWRVSTDEGDWFVERHTCAGCWAECRTEQCTVESMVRSVAVEVGRTAEIAFQNAIGTIDKAGASESEIESFMADVYDSDSMIKGLAVAASGDMEGDSDAAARFGHSGAVQPGISQAPNLLESAAGAALGQHETGDPTRLLTLFQEIVARSLTATARD